MGTTCCPNNPPTNTTKKEIEEDEHFQKLKKIGGGAFGEAFLIISEKTKLNYIAKIIKINNPTTENMKTVFKEVVILKKCSHPNIILFKEVFKQRIKNELTLNIITEYCDDGDLNMKSIEKKDKGEHFEEAQLICWLTQLCLALKYLHDEKKIIHRDIKPSNIFLTKKGYVKLGDFGLSKIFDNNTKDNKDDNINNINTIPKEIMPSLKGTLAFLAPEALIFHDYTEKTDIWALGITFYYLMNFSFPFRGYNFNNLCMNIAFHIIEKKPSYNNLYSQEFINLINSMIYHRPQERPTAQMILNSKVIRDRMAPFLIDNHFDYQAASKFIQNYENDPKNKIEEKREEKEKEIVEKNNIIVEENNDITLSEEDIQMQKQHKENKEEYEMNKLMSIINDIDKK